MDRLSRGLLEASRARAQALAARLAREAGQLAVASPSRVPDAQEGLQRLHALRQACATLLERLDPGESTRCSYPDPS